MQLSPRTIGDRRALVVTPTRHIRIGQRRLNDLRAGAPVISEVDQQILDGLRAEGATLLLFRGRDGEGAGSWGFDEALSDAEVDEVGYYLIRGQLPLYRRMVSEGVVGNLHVEWGPREVLAVRAGTDRLTSEFGHEQVAADTDRSRVIDFDLWVLRHFAHFLFARFEDVLKDFIPRTLPSLERRVPKLERLLSELPPEALSVPGIRG